MAQRTGPYHTSGPARIQVDSDEVEQLLRDQVLVADLRRTRPRYFDGRFLTAQDLIREQRYFLTRQADLGRAGGTGVVRGLHVRAVPNRPHLIEVTRGHGITPSGELVLLRRPVRPDLADLAKSEVLNLQLGIRRRGQPPLRTRSGLFVLAIRPIEFTANPRASYPLEIDGERTVRDGEVIEGAALTLIPYVDGGVRRDLRSRRAQAARRIFVELSDDGLPADALPLAMVGIRRGTLVWIDPYLVRREVGAEHGDILGFGLIPRAVREAHILHYNDHLEDLVQHRRQAGRSDRIVASSAFDVLPPVGRLPASAVNPDRFDQVFFPSSVDVDLSFIPEDEVATVVEESINLPPIVLDDDAETLQGTSVLILVPISRSDIAGFRGQLDTIRRNLLKTRYLRPRTKAAARALQRYRLPVVRGPEDPEEPPHENAWRSLLKQAISSLGADGFLWYVRRRNTNTKVDVEGRPRESTRPPGTPTPPARS